MPINQTSVPAPALAGGAAPDLSPAQAKLVKAFRSLPAVLREAIYTYCHAEGHDDVPGKPAIRQALAK